MSIDVVRDRASLAERLEGVRAGGRTVGLVPTMGALHEGHLVLVDEAKRRGAGFVVVTIFVNPLQFGPGEDLDRYPRTLDADVAACRERGVDLVWAPPPGGMYPEGFQTHVEVEEVTAPLEGVHRPGHFRGVTTVVTKLFNVASPCLAVFGRKDYQQLATIRRMARDLDMRVEVVGHPTVREADGLALSSRNRYLSREQRERALGIARGLGAACVAFEGGERDRARLEALAREPVERDFDRVDYVAVADPDSLDPIEGRCGERTLLAVAAHLGDTRLIDNVVLGEDGPPIPPGSTA